MRTKTVIGLLLILALLVIATVFVVRSGKPPGKSADADKPYFENFDADSIATILIEKENEAEKKSGEETESVTLENTEKGWSIADRWDFPAKQSQITELLDSLKDLTFGEVRSRSPESHEHFKLTPGKAVHLRADGKDGKTLCDFFIGKRAGMDGYFARETASDIVRVMPFKYYRTDPVTWLDKKCFTFKHDDIEKITVTWGNGSYTIVKKESEEPDPRNKDKKRKVTEWELTAPEKFIARESTARQIVGAVANFRFDDVIAAKPVPEYGLDKPSMTVTATVKELGDATITFGAFNSLDNNYYVKVSSLGHVVSVSQWNFKTFMKTVDDFREKKKQSPPRPDVTPARTPHIEPGVTPAQTGHVAPTRK